MKNNNAALSKKNLTKLLNPAFRKKILDSYKKDTFLINDYARYVVDSQIIQRMKGLESDAKAGWGFPQLNMLCCIKKDGTIEKKLFEFNSVNHFLKDEDGDTAVDVVKCILILWLQADKKCIESFDYEKIDAELVRLDKEIAEKKVKDQKIEETSKRIKSLVKPIIDKTLYEKYDEVAEETKKKVEKVLDEFVKAKQLAKAVVSLDRNTTESIAADHFFLDIGFKLEEKDDFSILVCHAGPSAEEKKDEAQKEKTTSAESGCQQK